MQPRIYNSQKTNPFNQGTAQIAVANAPNPEDDWRNDITKRYYFLLLRGYSLFLYTSNIVCILGVLLFAFGLVFTIIDRSDFSMISVISGPILSIISGLFIKPMEKRGEKLRAEINELNSNRDNHYQAQVIESIEDKTVRKCQKVKFLEYLRTRKKAQK